VACTLILQQRAAFNAQITSMEQSLSQVLSGPALATTIARLEQSRAAGNAQFDQALAGCGSVPTTTTTTSTTTTLPPPTTTTITAPPPTIPPFGAAICAVLRPLQANPFLGPFIQAFLSRFGCNATT
jgi:hypothetical protein